MAKSTTEYWKQWFDERARNASSDYVLNRGTTLRLDELETRSLEQFLQSVAPKSSDVVLDAGCGSGRNLSILSSRVKEIIGLDFSEEMLERARERVHSEDLANVSLTRGTVTDMKFPDARFDKVVCASVLQYLDTADCETSFREMIRVCKPSGTLVLHVKNGTSLYALSLSLLRVVSRLIGKEVMPEHYRSRQWHFTTLRKCGAAVIDYDSFGIFTFVPMPGALVRRVLQMEMRFLKGKWLKRFGVNLQITARAGNA